MAAKLRFIFGRAGTGKTHTCLTEIKNVISSEGEEGPALILLVPEQAAFQMEYELYTSLPRPATARAQVLSFRRLAHRVLSQTGGAARPWLGELGKRMVLRSLIQKHRDELVLFGRCAGTPGFTDRLAHSLAELKIYNISPEKLLQQAEQLTQLGKDVPLAGKLHDLALIYANLEEFLAGRFTDPEGYLALLATKLDQAALVQQARIWVDGFAGFTPQEFEVLAGLMKTAAEINITLCLTAQELLQSRKDTDLFNRPRETYEKLLALAVSSEVKLAVPVVLDAKTDTPFRFSSSAELAYLERFFFTYPTRAWSQQLSDIVEVAAANRRVEVEAVAREIVHLVRQRGWRWRDMVLVVRDLELYHDLIATVFTDHRIPTFIDRKRPVLHHPLVRLVLAIWEIIDSRWSPDPVFRCLRTDLLPLSRSDVDCLENYVLAYGIRGQTWLRKASWDFHCGREHGKWPQVDELRWQIVSWLRPVIEACQQPNPTGISLTTALWSCLEQLELEKKLSAWADEAAAAGDWESAQEHRQLWTNLLKLLDELVIGLGDTVLTPAEYFEILASGLEGLQLGLIPPTLDRVLVGSLERSRHPNARGAFVLGVNEGVLPGYVREDAVFSDREREDLAAAGIELAPTSRTDQLHERYLTYIALTRASEYLWISYPLADAEGKGLAPSRVVTRLRELFPALPQRYVGTEPAGVITEDLKLLTNPAQAAKHLVSQLRRAQAGQTLNPIWVAVQQYLCSQPELVSLFQQAILGLKHKNQVQPLAPAVAKSLYGRQPRISVTRLEQFAACPFKHFAYYGLRLRTRTEYGLDLPSLGMFTHAILNRVTQRLLAQKRGFDELNASEAAQLVQAEIENLTPSFSAGVFTSSPRYAYLSDRLGRIITTAVKMMGKQAERGQLKPWLAEAKFGFDADAVLPGLKVRLADGTDLALTGQIDRIDIARSGDELYFTIIDYKSRPQNLTMAEIYFGLSLQLLIYLLVVKAGLEQLEEGEVFPAGVFYFGLQEGFVYSSGPLDPDSAVTEQLKKFRLRGLVHGEPEIVRLLDQQGGGTVIAPILTKAGGIRKNSPAVSKGQLELLLDFVAWKMKELGLRVLNGEVQVAPYKLAGNTACDWCDFAAVCQFDPVLADNAYRILPGLAEKEIWQIYGERSNKNEQA
ncbi:MAG: helicase-exonuclease AddAB subunit AddB [Firmicutes bacterium]|nr:helicase-exonuclease AddAB subunit AddB [Bacillota bacterium]